VPHTARSLDPPLRSGLTAIDVNVPVVSSGPALCRSAGAWLSDQGHAQRGDHWIAAGRALASRVIVTVRRRISKVDDADRSRVLIRHISFVGGRVDADAARPALHVYGACDRFGGQIDHRHIICFLIDYGGEIALMATLEGPPPTVTSASTVYAARSRIAAMPRLRSATTASVPAAFTATAVGPAPSVRRSS